MWRVIMLSTEEKITGALSSGDMGLSICQLVAITWPEFGVNGHFQSMICSKVFW